MAVAWTAYAQSLTTKPGKGMLTGLVAVLPWSFVRDDQPRSLTTEHIAETIHDEVLDLEGIGIVPEQKAAAVADDNCRLSPVACPAPSVLA